MGVYSEADCALAVTSTRECDFGVAQRREDGAVASAAASRTPDEANSQTNSVPGTLLQAEGNSWGGELR